MGKGKRNPDTPVSLRSRLKHLPETCQLSRTVAHKYITQSNFDSQSVISSSQYNNLVTKFRDGANIVAETPFMQHLFSDTYFKRGKLFHRRRRVVCVDEFHEALLSFPLHNDLSHLHDSVHKRFIGFPALLVNLWHARLAEPQYTHLVAASRAAAAAKALKEVDREKMNVQLGAEIAARIEAYHPESEGDGALPAAAHSIANILQDASATPSVPVPLPAGASVSDSLPVNSVQETALEEHTSSSLVDAPALGVSTPPVTTDSTNTPPSSSLIDYNPPSAISRSSSPSDDSTATVHMRTVVAKRRPSDAADDAPPSPKRIKIWTFSAPCT
ncbi:hypothetical protein CPB85DRAFT_1313344 [Mucidula mucida]|nr:hypothetical protein CPB85DRAFT_1313344 [Mucidula mucida]